MDKFTVDINGVNLVFLNFSNLQYERDGDSYSIILPYSNTTLKRVTSSSANLRVVYSNTRFSGNFFLNVSLYSAIILKNAEENTTVLPPGSEHTFVINYESLAEPSCASVIYSAQNYQSRSVAIGTDQPTCQSMYPGLSFEGPYDKLNSQWRIKTILSVEGNIKMTAAVKNSASTQTVSSIITVTSLACAPPLLNIDKKAEFFYLPIKIARTKIITLLAESTLRCNLTLENEKGWQLFLVDPSNGANRQQIDLSRNPTSKFAEIVVQPNALNYGLYKFVFTVRMIGSNLMGRIFESSIESFIKVVPTGIVVWGLKGGIAERRLGLDQQLEFTPALFSFDQDSLVSPTQLKYKFYCTTVDSGIARDYPRKNVKEKLDLLTLKSGAFTMTSNTTCFESPVGYEFSSDGNSIKIETKNLAYLKIRIYRFMIATEYLDEEYYQEFDLALDFVKKTPIITLGYFMINKCKIK